MMGDEDPRPQSKTGGCEPCRKHHVRCDRVLPSCDRCVYTGRQCIWTGLRVRFQKVAPFPPKQKWIKTPRRLVFIDETKAIVRAALRASDPASPDVDPDYDSPEPLDEDELLPITPPLSATGPTDPPSPSDRFLPGAHDDAASCRTPTPARPATQVQADWASGSLAIKRPCARKGPLLPLTDANEAKLFRHYVQNLATWLDVCDPRKTFQTVVPQRARNCRILLNAILALAARHMSHTSGFPSWASNKYHDLCLMELFPMINTSMVDNEDLFAATIILRMLEEIEAHVDINKEDNNRYLLGIHMFVNAVGQKENLDPQSLSAACFWVGLRQEIYSATMNKKPVGISLKHVPVAGSDNDHDFYWANRAVLHCAQVINFCFGIGGGGDGGSKDGGSKDGVLESPLLGHVPRRWALLNAENRTLWDELPPSFQPMFSQDGAFERFPEIWYTASCHVVGIQHHLLAELLLTRFNPSIPRVGGQGEHAERQTEECLQRLVRRLLGIGLGNTWTPPGMFMACQAIAAFGSVFDDPRDHRAMLSMLQNTETDHMRPTEKVQEEMRRCWSRRTED